MLALQWIRVPREFRRRNADYWTVMETVAVVRPYALVA